MLVIGLNKTSLFFPKNIMKRSCCKLLTRTVTNTPLISLLIYLCCGKSLFFFLFLSLTFLLFQKLFGHSSIFYIYKTSTFPPCPNMHDMLSWGNTVELVFGENSKHHSRTRVKCTRLVLFITTGGRLHGDIIWGLWTAGHF